MPGPRPCGPDVDDDGRALNDRAPEASPAAAPSVEEAGLARRAARALQAALRRRCAADRFGVDGRLRAWADNLIPGIDPAELVGNGAGAGQVGWRSVDSAAMLAINSFHPWRQRHDRLPLAGEVGYQVLRSDARCPTGVRGTPPHLDLLALRADRVVAVTAQCTGYLGRKRSRLATAYQDLAVAPELVPWRAEMARLREDPLRYRHVDAASLVKLALGLGRTFPDRPVTLVYLFWEPLDADRYAAFPRHRAELAALGERVAGAGVALLPQTFMALWEGWRGCGRTGIDTQIAHLHARYAVSLGGADP
jgi:hypothetical protein